MCRFSVNRLTVLLRLLRSVAPELLPRLGMLGNKVSRLRAIFLFMLTVAFAIFGANNVAAPAAPVKNNGSCFLCLATKLQLMNQPFQPTTNRMANLTERALGGAPCFMRPGRNIVGNSFPATGFLPRTNSLMH